MTHLAPAALPTFIAFALTALLVPLVRRACIRLHVYDAPGPLKIHARPIPRLGGIAIALALAASAGLAAYEHTGFARVWPFFAALGLIWITGLIDDLRGLSPAIRIAAQVAAAALLWQAGWRLPWPANGPFGLVAAAIFMIAFVNAFNFLDGADGIAASVAATIASVYVVHPDALSSACAASAAAGLLGICVGFVLFNFPPAKIFMGDSGSTVLGFCVAFLALDFYRGNGAGATSIAFPIVVAGLPILDAVFAVQRRLQNRASPFYGDRRHFYDLLLSRGWRPSRVVFVCVAITAALSVAASIALRVQAELGAAIQVLSVAALAAAAIRLGSLRADDARRPRAPMPRAITPRA
jgi:UDP-GlcNAc:undecaprenyl-phosphate/decaprenyl-phosphate GlcNAc-1-phosphate transferase